MDYVEAVKLMVNSKIKKLPITHREELMGILTITDILRLHPVMQELIEEESKEKIPDKFVKRLRKTWRKSI